MCTYDIFIDNGFFLAKSSYLGLGLMAARKQILSANNPEGASTLKSPCINPMIKKGWNYSGVNYIVR